MHRQCSELRFAQGLDVSVRRRELVLLGRNPARSPTSMFSRAELILALSDTRGWTYTS
jgi:hypothetical protein